MPGGSCAAERLFFAPFAWPNTFENAPTPTSATKTPVRQRTRAIVKRGLKKADRGLSFFFMGLFG